MPCSKGGYWINAVIGFVKYDGPSHLIKIHSEYPDTHTKKSQKMIAHMVHINNG
jgi:hypothetical protein